MEPDKDTYPITTTLEEYLRQHETKAVDFMIRVDWSNGYPVMIIHPHNVDGDTLDYKVSGNTVECVTRKFKPFLTRQEIVTEVDQFGNFAVQDITEFP